MDSHKSLPRNISEMGLVFDVNKSFGMPNNKKNRVIMRKKLNNGFIEEDNEETEQPKRAIPKSYVAENLEKDARAPRESKSRSS